MYVNLYDLLIEENLKKEERDKLKDSDFGIPSIRGYPIHDETHVRAAIKLFSKADEKYKHELANKIFIKAQEYGIIINKNSELYKYLSKENQNKISNNSKTLNEDSIFSNENENYQIFELNLDVIETYKERLSELKFILFQPDIHFGFIMIDTNNDRPIGFIYGNKLTDTILKLYIYPCYSSLGYQSILINKMIENGYNKVVIHKDDKLLLDQYLNCNFIITSSTKNYCYLTFESSKNINNKNVKEFLLETIYEEIHNDNLDTEVNALLEDSLNVNEFNILLHEEDNEVLENIKGIDRFRNKDKYGVKYMDFAPNEKDDLVKKEIAKKLINEDTFITSDLHLNYKERSSLNFIVEMINEINYKVPQNGTLLFLGDLGDKRNPSQKFYIKNFISKLNVSKKILILGNHDTLSLDDYYNMGFLYVGIQLETSRFIFTHAPVPCKNKINIHGHIHGSREYWNMDWHNHIDVYCKDHNNKVLKLKEYLKLFESGKYDGKTVKKDFNKEKKDLKK